MLKINLYLKWTVYLMKYLLIYPLALVLHMNKNYKNLWLIAERGTDARDSAYHLVKYIHSNQPNLNIAFVITKDSPDRKKVTPLAKVINKGSWKHYLYFCLADIKISTHIMGYAPDMLLFMKLDKIGLVKGKKVFLQHGITKDNLSFLYYPNVRLDLFVCGAKPEFDFVYDKFNFNEDVVKYLGLCRFDNLHDDKVKKQILLMPTWRIWLNNCKDIEAFKQSEYYIQFNNLINNKKVINLLKKYGYEMVFYPHYEVQKYIQAFKSSSSNIKIACFKDFDVQALLKESAVLITDYSSVYFDFAYMKRPVLYFQFDYEKFCKSQYAKGYFDYEKDGFGPVAYKIDSIYFNLNNLLENNCINNDYFKTRQERFFPLFDNQNCKRNFEEICKLSS